MSLSTPISLIASLTENEKAIFKVLLSASVGLSQGEIIAQASVPLSAAALSRHLSKMIEKKIVDKTGQTKGAKFQLVPEMKYWATPAHRRAPVPFRSERILNYTPNQNFWLDAAFRETLHTVSPSDKTLDASTYSRSIAERFLIDLSFASSALEGNTYSLLETESLLKYGEHADDKNILDAAMILNHKRAIVLLLENVSTTDITVELAKKVHTLLMRDLLEPRALGKVRTTGVKISSSSYVPSEDHRVLNTCLGDLLFKSTQIEDPYEAMFFLMAGIAYLQPFEDGNKRMGRLLGNLPLLRAGLPPLSFIGVNKTNYIQGLIEFYELGHTITLGHALSEGYVSAAHVYQSSTTNRRTPKSIELRRRNDINSVMKTIIENGIVSDTSLIETINEHTKEWPTEEQEVFRDVVLEHQKQLDATNSVLWDVDTETVERYLNSKNSKHKMKI